MSLRTFFQSVAYSGFFFFFFWGGDSDKFVPSSKCMGQFSRHGVGVSIVNHQPLWQASKQAPPPPPPKKKKKKKKKSSDPRGVPLTPQKFFGSKVGLILPPPRLRTCSQCLLLTIVVMICCLICIFFYSRSNRVLNQCQLSSTQLNELRR